MGYGYLVIYLASLSPQRVMLLRRAGISFTQVKSRCDEDAIVAPRPDLLALERSRAKARGAVLTPDQIRTSSVALGADTVVALGNTIVDKPVDRADAVRLLSLIQGTTHSVFTGHALALFKPDGSVVEAARIAVAQVTMRPLSLAEIEAYVATGESDGRAGAYAIQETGDRFVTDLKGGWDTVVGLNVAMTARLFRELTEAWPEGYSP